MAIPNITITEREDLVPLCSFCARELLEVFVRRRGAALFQGRTVVFFCPHCRKVLGVGQERAA